MINDIYGSGWFAAPNWIFEHKLSPYEIVVLVYLHRRAGPDGASWPSIPRIALDCGVSERTVQRTLSNLREKGFIVANERRSASGVPISYVFELRPVTTRADGDSRTPGMVSEGHHLYIRNEGLPNKKDSPLVVPHGEPTTKRFVPPSLVEVEGFFSEKGVGAEEAARFWNYYDSKGWKVGKAPMVRWRSAAAGWISRTSPVDSGYDQMMDRLKKEFPE